VFFSFLQKLSTNQLAHTDQKKSFADEVVERMRELVCRAYPKDSATWVESLDESTCDVGLCNMGRVSLE
jgi:hypothetical protein